MTGHLQRCSSADVMFQVMACFPTLFQTCCKALRFHSSSLNNNGTDHEGSLPILRHPLGYLRTLLFLYSKEEMSLDIYMKMVLKLYKTTSCWKITPIILL